MLGNTALAVILLVLAAGASGALAVTSPYVRPGPRETLPLLREDADADGQTPQQVHISVVGSDKMRVSWITEDNAPAVVEYGTTPGQYPFSANGTTTTYKFLL